MWLALNDPYAKIDDPFFFCNTQTYQKIIQIQVTGGGGHGLLWDHGGTTCKPNLAACCGLASTLEQRSTLTSDIPLKSSRLVNDGIPITL